MSVKIIIPAASLTAVFFIIKNSGGVIPEKAAKLLYIVEVLALILCISAAVSENTPVKYAARPEVDEDEKDETYLVSDGKQKEKIKIKITEKKLTKKQAEKLFKEAEAEIEKTLKGDNKSLSEVKTDLDVRKSYCNGLVISHISFGDGDYIGDNGEILTEKSISDPVIIECAAELSAGDHRSYLSFPIRLLPPETDSREGFKRAVETEANQADKKGKEKLRLPSKLNGRNLRWYQKSDNRGITLSILGIAAAIGIIAGKKAEEKKREDARKKDMERDYTDIISSLSLYISSGITVKNAFERISETYIKEKKGKARERPGYELIVRAVNEIDSGAGEREALRKLGTESKDRHFKKLVMMIISDMDRGTGTLSEKLLNERKEIYESERNGIRARGEKLSTELLAPMICLLMVILVVLIYPALSGVTSNMQ